MEEPRWRRRKAARPAEIVEAALEVFAQNGFAAAKLDDIARRAGVSKAALYLYFETKEELFRAVAQTVVAPNLQAVEALVAAADAPFVELMPRLFDRAAGLMSGGRVPAIARMVIGEARNFPDLARIWRDDVVARVLAIVEAAVARAQARGELRDGDPRLLAFSIMGPMLMGLLYREVFAEVADDAPDLHALGRSHSDLLLGGLLTVPGQTEGEKQMSQTQVLIAGAGPSGLVLALWLTKLGVRVRIVDKTAEPGTTSRALAVHARTLELYRQLDLTDAVLERGYKVPGVRLWVKGEPRTHLDFTKLDVPLSPYAFLEIFPQDEHERLLIARLQALGVSVERRTELLGFTDADGRVTARLRGPDGAETTCEADYVAGCDGARSVVRHVIGADFPGGTYQQLFYVADVEAGGPPMNGLLNVGMDQADFLAIFPLAGCDRARLIGTIREDRVGDPDKLKFEDVSSQAIEHLKIQVREVNWFSTYRVHHRVTDRFRAGRAFLVGDAAHIHSPAGGQGMNTGIGDAINLAWKLAWVLTGRAPDRLLDSYQAERIDFARRLVATTDRLFSLISAEGVLADFMRTGVIPTLMPAALSFEAAREYIFRTVSQITLNYRDGPISAGHAGKVRGGDRLPWAAADGPDNFEPLKAMVWQVHVYGEARPDLRAWCEAQKVPLHVFAWSEACDRAGLARDAAYVIRPDTYVALAEPGGAPGAIERYFADQQFRPA